MLKVCLFENSLGIRLSGDILDLVALQATVRKITTVLVDYGLQDTDASNLLVDFLKKIERAYSEKELREEFLVHNKAYVYFGFDSIWTELLTINGLLRLLSEYTVVDEMDEINIQMLEYLSRKAMADIEGEDAVILYHYIGKKFTCLNIKEFIIHFRYNNRDFSAKFNENTLKEVQQYLNPYFGCYMQCN